jgi:transcription-repair coupling factor (superfamily II helicase)
MAAIAEKTASPEAPTPSIGAIAAQLSLALKEGDILFAATDEPSAICVAQALTAAAPDAVVLFCPGSDALPGDDAPASPVNVGRRVSALRAARLTLSRSDRPRVACVTTGAALGRLYPPPPSFEAALPKVAIGDTIALPSLFSRLEAIGYIADERVDEPGEVALRGKVLDVYPADADAPLRIEAVEGKVASIRIYDPAGQRATGECEQRELGRVSEPPLDGQGVTLLAHLPDARIVIPAGAEERRKRFLLLAHDAQRRRPRRAISDIADDAIWEKALEGRETLELVHGGNPPTRFVECERPDRAFARTVTAAIEAGQRVVMLGGERDLRFLSRRASAILQREVTRVSSWDEVVLAKPRSILTLAMPADRSFRADGVLAIAAPDLIGSRAERADAVAASAGTIFLGFSEIRVGDVVVHEVHGIAVVAGLEPMPSVGSDNQGDAIKLCYADGGTRLVPIEEADRIWRYGAEKDAVTLDKLDGGNWVKRRETIEAAIAESARRLTEMAAERASRSAPSLVPVPAEYEAFASTFPFSETADQAKAIGAVRTDLASGRPMDRLVVGDVGYGKTEVALRAAAIAALAGRQVAIAAPTTVLARQHLESFTERFEGTGVVVAGLSRLSSAAERKRVKAGLSDGSVHVVVGTSAVAAKGVAYKHLALMVIDEEQRFGAADKTRMRMIGAGHVLTLSATPIPRTLQTALIGLQQLSIIATPPVRRQPIRTSVGPFVPESVRTALLREKSRGGQSFVVVPRIADMGPVSEQLSRVVPELELVQAHGKMPAAEVDEAMVSFGRGDGDVLLATNIIEAGLDVPRANTMIIMRPDRFGLSQLHQLRGRVGRGNRRGQVMLLTDAMAEVSPRTLKRLRALEAFDRLGAGFAISARDLDMRGAGDLMGEAQAGHMKLIGIDLYQRLLETAVRTARGEKVECWTPEVHLAVQGRIPEGWLPDEDLRISLYCRLARVGDPDQLEEFVEELEDRFGALPPDVATLLRIAGVRLAARSARVARIDAGPAAIALTLREDFTGNAAMAGLIEKNGRFLLTDALADPMNRLKRVETLLSALAED